VLLEAADNKFIPLAGLETADEEGEPLLVAFSIPVTG